MTLQGHTWFRYGWYRSISEIKGIEHFEWIKRLNRLAKSGSRANAMGLQFLRIENGGTEHKFLDCGLDI